MKTASLIMTMSFAALLSAPALADHNSNFGDNTGRTVAGVHDDRIDSNLKGADNATAMGDAFFQVESESDLSAYQQAGYPLTVIPGSGGKQGSGR